MAPPSAIELPQATDDIQAATIQSGPLSINGVPGRRAKAPKLSGGLAPYSCSDMFKGPGCGKPKARHWDHYLTAESKARKASSLKNAAKYLSNPGLISLGGGLPSSQYFPFERIDIKVPRPPHFSEQETAESGIVASAGKHDIAEGRSLYDIHVALNYGQAIGSVQLLRFVTEHTEIVHNPPYQDWHCSLTTGSTSALDMAYRMLVSSGDYLLTEEYTFSSAMETCRPLGVGAIGIKMDEQGLIPSALDETLDTWDPAAHGGARKPHLLYTVPSGQNPTGATQGAQRRRDIYAVAQKHDLYILEDEPYYFLQMPPYTGASSSSSSSPPAAVPPPASHEAFLASLVPSLLSIDADGRVMRLDSFSKVVAPGSRVGWITASAQMVEAFVRHGELSTQNPSGISQLVLYKLLEESWGHAGYFDWLINLRLEYTRRRDVMCRACDAHLPTAVASWTPAAAGMFQFFRIDWRRHPQAAARGLLDIEDEVHQAAIHRGVLTAKGSWFRAAGDAGTDMFFRATFAAASEENITEAIRRFGEALRAVFGVE